MNNKLNYKKLSSLLYDEFEKNKLCPDSNFHVVNSMVETSLRGVDSHGINLFPHYYRALKAKRINSKPSFNIISKSNATAILDADHAFGHHAGSKAINIAQKLAEKNGVGIISVKKSTHFGSAGYFALQASKNNYLSFAFTNADALVRVTNAKAPFLSISERGFEGRSHQVP